MQNTQFRQKVQSELNGLTELAKQLRKVKNQEEMKSWNSRFNMCLPILKVSLNMTESLSNNKLRYRKSGK